MANQETYQEALFRLLTSDNSEAEFQEVVTRRIEGEIQRIALQMEANPDYFIAVIGNQYGSIRVPRLFNLSRVADAHFCNAILSRFLDIMTYRDAYFVAVRAMLVFDQPQRRILHEFTLFRVLDIARTRYGYLAVDTIITYTDQYVCKSEIMDKVTANAFLLCKDFYGALVVKKVLELNTLRATRLTLGSLRGHFVQLSFTKQGSDVVNQLMGRTQEALISVVDELLRCGDDRLVSLVNDEFGTDVVRKALLVTGELVHELNLFSPLVHRLKSLRDLMRDSTHGSVIGNFLDATIMNELRLNDLRTTHTILGSLRGHCVELSFTKPGIYVVEQLLETRVDSMSMAACEILECQGDRLKELTIDESRTYVVRKALTVTTEKMHPAHALTP